MEGDPQPNPDRITGLIAKWTTIIGVIGGIAAWLLTTGVVDSIGERYPWLPPVVTLLAGVGGAVTGGRLARRGVTPVDNPQVELAGKLVALVPKTELPVKDNRPTPQSRIAKDRSP